ncbi:alcohol dehydrogenase family protein [Mesorhizobium sp. M0012]|uniref:alcohol dehydrogenase family protein n=1 Tax=Mesorhizobium sp. M0012 TaxID=2956840 RepID=UPI003334ACD9
MDTLPTHMVAVHLTGHGGLEKLEYRDDVPLPRPAAGEVLIRVGAAGVNNTDINTRLGWYSKVVKEGTNSVGEAGTNPINDDDASWSGTPMTFPRIQGADCCGRIVAVGDGVSSARLGDRVIVKNMLRSYVAHRPYECWTFGSECDGAFAQYTKAPAREVYPVICSWSDAELASIPCAYSTAENMLHRANVSAGETVLITGASGGVGSAAIQLARRRGAEVIATTSASKAAAIMALGAHRIVSRDADPLEVVGPRQVDVVLDIVGGEMSAQRIETLKAGGRYAVAGAIAGPLINLDLRVIYLRDLTVFGCTFQEDAVFENLVSYIERDEIRPLVSQVYPLSSISEAQQDFLNKGFVGKLVLTPPQEQNR